MMERVVARGHRNVRALHRSTMEITRDEEIGRSADCIIAVSADKGIRDLSERFKEEARHRGSIILFTINAGGLRETVRGRGHPELSFAHPTDMVLRRSEFICDRTLMICADKSARDLDRALVRRLQDPDQEVEVTIEALPPPL